MLVSPYLATAFFAEASDNRVGFHMDHARDFQVAKQLVRVWKVCHFYNMTGAT